MEWSLVDGHLTISGEITHTTNKSSDWPWSSQVENIQSVSFSNAYFTSGSNAYGMFEDCESLTSLDLSSFDTSNVTSMCSMFDSCESLTSLDLSNFNTSNVTDMSYMFYDCDSLTSLDLSSFDTSNVTSMYSMFDYCDALTSLDLSNFNTSNVTTMSGMFSDCSSLTSLDLSSFDTSKVTSMGGMFKNCRGLTSILWSTDRYEKTKDSTIDNTKNYYILNLSTNKYEKVENPINENIENYYNFTGFNTSKVISMGYMFSDCRSLTSLNLSFFDTSNVTYIRDMFNYCNTLTSLDLSSFNTSNVTNMSEMFCGCSSLLYIRISNLWTTVKVSNSLSMFLFCNKLPNYNKSLTDKDCAYAGSGGYLSDDVCAYYDSSDNTLNFIGCYKNQYTSGTIGTKTYYTGFEDATLETAPGWIDKSFTTVNFNVIIKPKTTYKWFYNRSSLTTFNNLQLLDTSKVTHMSYMFDGCSSLTSLDLSNFNTSNVTDMSDMFYRCFLLTSLDLSSFNTSNVTNMESMFYNCYNLTSILWSNDNDKYKKTQDFVIDHTKNYYIFSVIDNKFKKVDNPIQENIENYYEFFGFNTQKVTDMASMFSNCRALTSLNLSNFDTSVVTDMSYMFTYCSKLTSLDLSNFNTLKVDNMSYMFNHCLALTSLDLSSFNTSAVTDMSYMLSFLIAEIPVLYLDTVHNGANIFTGSTGRIYLVRRNPTEDENNNNVIRNDWRNYIAQNNYTSVFLEYDGSTRPTASLELNRGKFENNKWEADEVDGGVIKIELHSNVYNDNKADNEYLAPNSIKSVTAVVNKNNYIKNIDYTVDYQAANDLIYLTLLTLPDNQYDITVTITDKSDIPVSFTAIIPGIFAMIEFKAGGRGMSIGKICERNGLEVSIPTTIGKGLLSPAEYQEIDNPTGNPSEQEWYEENNGEYVQTTDTTVVSGKTYFTKIGVIDLTNYQLVIGKYNEQKNKPLFIIGNGTDDTHRSNLMEVGENEITIGNIYISNNDLAFIHNNDNAFTIHKYDSGTIDLKLYYSYTDSSISYSKNVFRVFSDHPWQTLGEYWFPTNYTLGQTVTWTLPPGFEYNDYIQIWSAQGDDITSYATISVDQTMPVRVSVIISSSYTGPAPARADIAYIIPPTGKIYSGVGFRPNQTDLLTIGNGSLTTDHNAMIVDVYGNILSSGMAGQIIMYAGQTAPKGWLLCQGQAVSTSSYPELFLVIGYLYGGSGDTFNLPDFRGRVGVGTGNGTATGHTNHTLNQKAGNENAIVPSHRHNVAKITGAITGGSHHHPPSNDNYYLTTTEDSTQSGQFTTSSTSDRWAFYASTSGKFQRTANTKNETHTHDLPQHYTDYAPSSTDNKTGANMPPYIGINYIICTGKTYDSEW